MTKMHSPEPVAVSGDTQTELQLERAFGQLMQEAGLVFVNRSAGEYTTSTVSRDTLLKLMRQARAL